MFSLGSKKKIEQLVPLDEQSVRNVSLDCYKFALHRERFTRAPQLEPINRPISHETILLLNACSVLSKPTFSR